MAAVAVSKPRTGLIRSSPGAGRRRRAPAARASWRRGRRPPPAPAASSQATPQATASPAPAASATAVQAPGRRQLPYTGADAGLLALAGAVLLGAGVALRRRADHQR